MKHLLFIFLYFISLTLFAQNDELIGTFTDSRDGKTYKTVRIGEQIWMAENLAFKYMSGCWSYDNNVSNVAAYGYLYNWETANNVCPEGWHLPSKSDFETLIKNVGFVGPATYNSLKQGGSSGFMAPFGGWRDNNTGRFHDIGKDANFWSSSAEEDDEAWYLFIISEDSEAENSSSFRSTGYSVRCLKDN